MSWELKAAAFFAAGAITAYLFARYQGKKASAINSHGLS